LVVGGTSGIGFAVAEASLESGASVTISSSRISRVESAVERLKKTYPSSKVAGYPCDLSKPTLEKDIEALFEKTGKIDHIVYTAGDQLVTVPVQKLTYESICAAGQVRFIGALLVSKVGSRYLNPGPQSSITLTSGIVADRPRPGWIAVTAYASGLEGMVRSLALDLKPIRVNLVKPGAILTEIWDDFPPAMKEQFIKNIEEKAPTGKIGQPEDIAEAYLWCMKDKNATGVVASSEGGALLV